MNKILKINIVWVVLLLMTSCQKYLDINVDPTLKADASVAELLPSVQFYTSSSSYNKAYTACQYAQQLGSALGNNGTDANYESENSGGWSSFYLYVIPQLDAIIKKGEKQDIPAYVGIAKVLMAYNLGLATTSWENIPYSQANKNVFTPSYDTQESIYTKIQALLDDAIVELAKNTGQKPTADDLIYNGDTGKWTRLAYSLKAKYVMHLSAKNGASAAQTAIVALAKGMLSNADDFQMPYNSKNLSPWYSNVALANSTANVSITFASTYIDLLNGNTTGVIDPRLPLVVSLKKGQTNYTGAAPGTGSGSTVDLTTSSWHSNVKSPIVLMTYAESKAIEAEAQFIASGGSINSVGTNDMAYKAYLEMIKADMSKIGVNEASQLVYLKNPIVDKGKTSIKLIDILREKYKAMILNGDIWTDLRKYNYLDFQIPANLNPDLGGKFIQRMKYPSSELTRNASNAEANLFKPTAAMWFNNK